MDDLLTDFIAETRETLDALAGAIVAWEADPTDRPRLDAIFRFVHTVKGSCGFLDLPRLQRLSHAAEDALSDVRAGSREPDAALVSAVLAVIDRIAELTDAMESGEPLPDGEETFLIAALAEGAAPIQPRTSAASAQAPARTVARSIRLPVDLLDRMMAGVSDMVLARNELGRQLRDLKGDPAAEVAFERLSLCVGEMREAITRTRMARIDALFAVLPRLVRDLGTELGKQVMLEIDGGDVELDRELIEMIRDPLVHIIRNAIDHGIETAEDRARAGKRGAGRLTIGARQAGNQILIDVADDGRGIDVVRLTEKAIAAGLLGPEEAAAMSRDRKLGLIFEPGLSTASAVTEISGRGVGMDVVRANIERIGGTVEIDSAPGQGLRLALRVPLTLTIIPALIVSSGGCSFAIPRSAIDEIVRPNGAAVRVEHLGGGLVANVRAVRLPIVDLARFMALPAATETPPFLVVLRSGGGERYALGVECVHDHEELVVKPAAPALMSSGIYAGTTLPDNSRPMLLLDVAGIATVAGVGVFQDDQAEAPEGAEPAALTLPTLLFQDLDGVRRGVRLSLVERIEDVATDGVVEVGGTRLIAHDGVLAPLHAAGPLPARARMRILRLSNNAVNLAYAIDQVIDVAEIGVDLIAARNFGPVAGVTLHDGAPVEMVDPFWLFTEAARDVPRSNAPPLCLLADADDPWAREVLAPLLRNAGYRVSFAGEDIDGRVAVIVTGGTGPTGVDAPVVRLRARPDDDANDGETIYRDDRTALLRALGSTIAMGGRR